MSRLEAGRGAAARRGIAHALLAGAAAVTLALGGLLVAAAPASAIPSDGAGADTPGTSSSVSPSTVAPCGTLSFSLAGFPAGETVYIKIDDGVGYGDASVQGSGVWHMQAIGGGGSVSGSFALPCDIAPGTHWLRYLASAEKYDAQGTYQGVIGYTNRGGSTFTVAAGSGDSGSTGAGTTGAGAGTSSSGLGAAAPSAGTTVGEGSEQVGGQGGTLTIDAAAVETPTPSSPTPTASPSATPAASAAPTADASSAEVAAPAGIPVVGIAVAGVLVVVTGLIVWFVLRRPTPTP